MRENAEAEAERIPKEQRQMLNREYNVIENAIDGLLQKYSFWKTLQITAYIVQFITNCKGKEGQKCMLTSDEIQRAENIWIKRVQN